MTANEKRLMIVAGEPSGDILAARLAQEMRARGPYHFFGVAGPVGQAAGITPLIEQSQFTVMGFTGVIKKLPFLLRAARQLVRSALQEKPDAVIMVDYPGFNLRLARALRKAGYKGNIVHYSCPQVWAWKQGRVRFLERYYNRVLCLYPFEPDFLSSSAVDACFVGHPAVQAIDSYSYSAAFYEMHDLNPQKPLLALFPGSRGFEVELCLPRMLEVARRMQTKDPQLQIAVSVASDRMAERIERILASSEDSPRIARVPAAQRYELMLAARGALVVSGTVCLELALHELPAVVVYDVTYINYLIARYIARLDLDFYCNVNIIAQREVYPERIAIHFTSDSVMEALGLLWEEGAARERCIEGCKEIRHSLEQNDPSQQAAGAVEELLSP